MPRLSTPQFSSSSEVRAALEEQQAQADALFNSIGEGVITIDEEGMIKQINRVALELLDLKEKEALGKWFPNVLIVLDEGGGVVDPIERPMTQALLTGKAINQKTCFLTHRGRKLPVAVTVSPIVLNNQPIGAVEVFRDITQEQEIDRMKSEFISIASHQLRTPLTAIKTYAYLLSSGYRGDLNDEQQEFMKIILSSIERMNELINILLDVSRIEAGKIHIVLKETNVHDLVKEIIDGLKTEADNKQIDIKLKSQKLPIIATVDQILTAEVISNLLTNAIKYTPPSGKITVSISEKNDDLIIKVKDNGYGIPKPIQDQIFTKFFRADNIRHREPSGTGLGLYMVKQIVENMGGHIRFDSQEDQGTTFTINIPKNTKPRARLLKRK